MSGHQAGWVAGPYFLVPSVEHLLHHNVCHEATFLLSRFSIDAIVFFVDAVVEEEKVERVRCARLAFTGNAENFCRDCMVSVKNLKMSTIP